jgi:hypothetical protein
MSKYFSVDTVAQAACSGLDTALFFPIGYQDWDDTKEVIRAICNSCPIQKPCLDYALQIKVSGVWGGKSETERHWLRKELGIVAKPIIVEV